MENSRLRRGIRVRQSRYMVTLKLLYYQIRDRLIHGNWTFSTKAKLPTTTASDHRASRTPTHPRERSLPIGDELAESPLVSKSRITQIVPVGRNTSRWCDPRAHSHFRLPPDCSPAKRTGTKWIFHQAEKDQAEKELTTLPGLRYSSGRRKGHLKILSIQAVCIHQCE